MGKYFATCNEIECFLKLIKIAVLFQRYGSFGLRYYGKIFSLMHPQTYKKRNLSG